jgi:TolB-like protein
MPFTKGSKKINISSIIVQFHDQILVKALSTDYSLSLTKNISPLRMVQYARDNYPTEDREFFYSTDEKSGSKIKIISFKEGTSDPESTVFNDQSNKILSIVKKTNNLFILQENFRSKVFTFVEVENKKTKLEVTYSLDCTSRTKDNLIANKEQVFRPFHRVHVSIHNVVHIENKYYRFFKDPSHT